MGHRFVDPSHRKPEADRGSRHQRPRHAGARRSTHAAFAADFFDAIVSFDAYQYFGTAGLHLGYLVDFLKPGGKIGVVMPTTTRGDRLRPATRNETVGHR